MHTRSMHTRSWKWLARCEQYTDTSICTHSNTNSHIKVACQVWEPDQHTHPRTQVDTTYTGRYSQHVTRIHTHTHAYTHTHKHTLIHIACIHGYNSDTNILPPNHCMYACVYMYIYICIHTYIHSPTFIDTYRHTCIHTYIHTYIHIQTDRHKHTHTHTQI